MSIIGSSFLTYYSAIRGPTGNTGPTGPTGPTGNTGPLLVGFTGNTGFGITGFTSTAANVLTVYINGTGSINLNIQGNSGVYAGEYAILQGASDKPYSVIFFDNDPAAKAQNKLKIYADGTEYKILGVEFDSLTNSIESVTTTSNRFTVKGRTYNFYPVGDTGNIAFVYENNKAKGVPNSKWNPTLSMLDIPLAAEKLTSFSSKNFDSSTITQNISGFSGSTGISIPKIIFTDGLPPVQNPWVTKRIELTPRTLIGTTGAVSLDTTFTKNVYEQQNVFTPQIITDENVGSCCLCELNETESDIKCIDYANKQYCLDMGGSFNTTSCAQRQINGDCFAEGACCVNNECVNTSQEKCLQYGGIFNPNKSCFGIDSQGNPTFSCPQSACPSTITGKCCVNGKCFNGFLEYECVALRNSYFSAGVTCSGITCDQECYNRTGKGGCCINGSVVQNYDAQQCEIAGGIFLGPGVNNTSRCCGRDATTVSYICGDVLNSPAGIPLGTKMAGGYLLGFIGEPSPSTSFLSPLIAEGQVLACRYYPRGIVEGSGSLTWKFKNCFGDNGSTLGVESNIKYFARTHPEKLTYDHKYYGCLFKGGFPYVLQTYEGYFRNSNSSSSFVKWGEDGMFDTPEEKGTLAYSNGDMSTVFLFEGLGVPNSLSSYYRNLAKQFYQNIGIPVLWALIVADRDIEISNNNLLRWGMCEGRVRNDGNDRYNLEPISTCPVDGLLTTRMHDESSKQNIYFWFREDDNGVDSKAYDRFCFFTGSSARSSRWNSNLIEEQIETNKNLFSLNYSNMWDANNPTDSCTKQVSILNQISYNGYSDWYIPSIVELNYIYGNLNDLNSSMALNGDQTIDEDLNYWSSTSMCSLKSWTNNDHQNYATYTLSESPNGDFNTKFRFTKNDFNLSDKELYDLSMNTCAGETMLVQNFNNGMVESKPRNQKIAAFRPVRRIPVVTISCFDDYSIINAYNGYSLQTCEPCPDGCG
jgi:hypothetical protein